MNNQTNQCQRCSEAKLGQPCDICFLDEDNEVKCSQCAANNDTNIYLDELDGKCKFECLSGMVHDDVETFSTCKCETGYATE